MNFLKSVFSEPSPSPSPPSSPSNHELTTSSWGVGSALFNSIASKSASFLDNYQKDLQEFSSGFKRETSIIREAANRAVSGFPARLESGAAIAQESLEAVGQAIDNVTELIVKELNISTGDALVNPNYIVGDYVSVTNTSRDRVISKPYSRLEAVIHALQCDVSTYCDEIDDAGYNEWKLEFKFEEKRDEISKLLKENNKISEIHDETVPERVDDETFWCRYFYRVNMAVKAEESRAMLVKKAISSEEDEELSWDIDEDPEANGVGVSFSEKEGKGVAADEIETQPEAGHKTDEEITRSILSYSEKDASDGKLGSDISIISSQRSSHAEEDEMEWHEIEGIPSGDEGKVESQKISSHDANNIRKRLSSTEDDEELSWDIEDEEENNK